MCTRLLRNLAINAALAPVVPLVLWCFNSSISFASLRHMFLLSLVYSNCVGIQFMLFMTPIWMYSGTLTPRICWLMRFAACLVMATVGTAIGTAIVLWIGLVGDAGYGQVFWQGYRFALLITVVVSAIVMLYESMKARLAATNLQLKQKELERERAMKLAAEATLTSLESRIHPHFLFNTINSVSSLIPKDPEKAERLLGQMSALLRFSLDAPQTGLVPLDRERKIVEDYLEIEQARFGERLRYELHWSGDPGAMVPPLAIQTLVENCVKHAIAPRREGGRIEVRTTSLPGGGLAITVTDDGPGFDASAMAAGHGLENLDARLRAIFPDHRGVNIQGKAGNCSVSFVVPSDPRSTGS